MSTKNRQMDRTRHALQDALVSLIREQEYQDIEIQAITERANTARVTFYRHYASKDDLLLDYLERLYIGIEETVDTFDGEKMFETESPSLIAIFELISKDKELYRRLLSCSIGMTLQLRVRHYIVEHISTVLAGTMRFAEQPIGLIANHMASCTIGYISWWLMSKDANVYNARQVAILCQTLALGGIMTILGHADGWKIPD